MAVNSATYTLAPGQWTITIPDHAFRRIIRVSLEGQLYEVIQTGIPGNLQVLFYPSSGSYAFELAFAPVDYVDPTTKKMKVIWKE